MVTGNVRCFTAAVFELFTVATVVTIVTVTLEALWLATTGPEHRVRNVGWVWIVQYASEQMDLSFVGLLPHWMNGPFDLGHPIRFLHFLTNALLASLPLAWSLAFCVLPAVVVVRCIRATPSWIRERAYPPAIITIFAVPSIFGPVYAVLLARRASGQQMLVVTALLACALCLPLVFAFRRAELFRRALRGLTVVSFAVVAVASLGGIVTAYGAVETSREQPLPLRDRPNIILISIDSLRADHLGSYGYHRDTSPTLDALAAEGVLFRTVVSSTSWTLPAHHTLLTSLPPELHGVVDDGTRLSGKALTLSEVLWSEGYTTAGIVSGPYLAAEYGYAQGFDLYDDYSVAKTSRRAAVYGVTSPRILARTESWLEQWNRSERKRPFFLFLHMWDVHYDYAPPPPYDTLFDPDYRGSLVMKNFMRDRRIHPDMPREDLAHVIALYDGEIRHTDSYLERLFDRLRELDAFDETIIAITSDHGDEFFEHGHKGHRLSLYDEVILVPLIVRYPPRVPAGTIVDRQVRLMDVAPTLLSLAGIPIPEEFGTPHPKVPDAERDLTPWIEGSEPVTSLAAFSHLHEHRLSVRTETSKWIEHPGTGDQERYDLTADPGERRNLVGESSDLDLKLHGDLAEWQKKWQAARPLAEGTEMTAEQIERLRSLGYIE